MRARRIIAKYFCVLEMASEMRAAAPLYFSRAACLFFFLFYFYKKSAASFKSGFDCARFSSVI